MIQSQILTILLATFVYSTAFAAKDRQNDSDSCGINLGLENEHRVPYFMGAHLPVHYPRSMNLDHRSDLGLLIARSMSLFGSENKSLRILFSLQDQLYSVGPVEAEGEQFYTVNTVVTTRSLPVSQVRMASHANHDLPRGVYIKERDLKKTMSALPFQTANHPYAHYLSSVENGQHMVFVVYTDHIEHKVMTREILGVKSIRIFQ